MTITIAAILRFQRLPIITLRQFDISWNLAKVVLKFFHNDVDGGRRADQATNSYSMLSCNCYCTQHVEKPTTELATICAVPRVATAKPVVFLQD